MHLQTRIEYWALQTADTVRNGTFKEDERVELKRELTDPLRAARRLAGHANAARGAPILWLLGIDEKTGEVGPVSDIATWWEMVRSHFDGPAPELNHITVPYRDSALQAMHFSTTRAPFVVKHPQGGVQFEVPWREASMVRSARREELLQLLVPATSTPHAFVRSGTLRIWADTPSLDEDLSYFVTLTATLYLKPIGDTRVVIPFHDCSVQLQTKCGTRLLPVSASSSNLLAAGGRSSLVYSTGAETIIDGPGQADFFANAKLSSDFVLSPESPVFVVFTLAPLGSLRPIEMQLQGVVARNSSTQCEWQLQGVAVDARKQAASSL